MTVLYQTKEGFEAFPPGADDAPAILALSGAVISRRQCLKPFSNPFKLARILPNLLTDKRLAQGDIQTDLPTFFTIGDKILTSYTISAEALSDSLNRVEGLSKGVLGATVLPFGLLPYAPKGKASILLSPAPDSTLLTLFVDGNGNARDFRQFLPEQWKAEGVLTLRGWQQAEAADIYAAAGVKLTALPKSLSKTVMPLALAKSSTKPEMLAVEGLAQLAKKGTLPILRILDKTTRHKLVQLCQKMRLWSVLVIFSLGVFVGALMNENAVLTQRAENQQKAVEGLFKTALPKTPLVDAPVQLSRRVGALRRVAGVATETSAATLPAQLLALHQVIQQAGLQPVFDDVQMTEDKLMLRGQLAALAEVDTLQALLQDIYPNRRMVLQNTNLEGRGRVTFQIQAEGRQ